MRKALLAVGLLWIAAGLVFWFVGRPAYRQYKEARALERAREFLAHGDVRNATFNARLAYALNSTNLEACLLMAKMAEAARAPQLLDWLRRVVEISPTLENKFRLVSTALAMQPPPCPLAARTLEELSGQASTNASYHVLSAELAIKLGRLREAEDHFLAASRSDPANQLHRLNAVVLRLRSTNEILAAQARAALADLRPNTNLALVALRWLVDDSLKRQDLPAAERFSDELVALPWAGPEDRLLHLAVVRQTQQLDFDRLLALEQARAATNPPAIGALSAWMIGQGLAVPTLQWLTNFPATVRGKLPVSMATSEAYSAARDWLGLETFLENQKWGELEFARLALLSRAVAEQDRPQAAEARWRQALHEAGDRLGPLVSLLSMAGNWGRQAAREDLLRHILQKFPRERWAFDELRGFYAAAGNTAGLNKLYFSVVAYEPANFVVRNNFAATAMLLKINLAKAHQAARELYAQHPQEGVIASTYAYSLHLQGRTRDGLAVLNQLSPQVLEDPAIALYYGVLLSADGQLAKAARYLKLTRPVSLLPEEKVLLAEASQLR